MGRPIKFDCKKTLPRLIFIGEFSNATNSLLWAAFSLIRLMMAKTRSIVFTVSVIKTSLAFDNVFQLVQVPFHNILVMAGVRMRTTMLVVATMVVIVVDPMSGLDIVQNAIAWEKI